MKRFNLILTSKEQQANSSKQRQSKKHTFHESEEEIEPEDALNLMFDYFDKKLKVCLLKSTKHGTSCEEYKKQTDYIKGKAIKNSLI